MQIRFWASVLLLSALASNAGAAQAAEAVVTKRTGQVKQTPNAKLVFQTQNGTRYHLHVELDAFIAAKTKPSEIRLIGELPGLAVIISDTYPSLVGGMSFCHAGEERFLRIISIAKRTANETFRIKLESCRENIELASQGIEWNPESATLHLKWLQGQNTKGASEERILHIDDQGRIQNSLIPRIKGVN